MTPWTPIGGGLHESWSHSPEHPSVRLRIADAHDTDGHWRWAARCSDATVEVTVESTANDRASAERCAVAAVDGVRRAFGVAWEGVA